MSVWETLFIVQGQMITKAGVWPHGIIKNFVVSHLDVTILLNVVRMKYATRGYASVENQVMPCVARMMGKRSVSKSQGMISIVGQKVGATVWIRVRSITGGRCVHPAMCVRRMAHASVRMMGRFLSFARMNA